mmetsp:Transcript_2774/g.5008  ORF Transcript_2774/g.5008 Transcript_2774/m.5008 type:complete len:417 (-) Transcript_2774:11-1261(-)
MARISALAPQNLSNTAWACALLKFQDIPLLEAIAAESIPRTLSPAGAFDAQGLSNMAWAFARMSLRHPPLLDAISAAALPNIAAFLRTEQQESYALLWSVWRVGESERLLEEFRRSALTPGGISDPLVRSILLAIDAWRGDVISEIRLESWISSSLPTSALSDIVSRAVQVTPEASRMAWEETRSNHFYRRLARLLEATAEADSTPEGILLCIESFGSVSSWLKVAGEAKAEVLADTISRRCPNHGESTLELGAFVGYSAIRFARQVALLRGKGEGGLGGASLEIDPIHVAVSRHHLDRAKLAGAAEIWVGQLQDTMPRVSEALGAGSLAFVFMDQRGTTFHEDLAQLERIAVMATESHSTADNTVKPGSPVYLWHVAVGASQSFDTVLWAMSEFALEEIEDWQAVSLLRGMARNQ